MKNINKKSINYGLKALTILAFVFVFIPFNRVSADTYITGCGDGGCNTSYGSPVQQGYEGPVTYTQPYQQEPIYNNNQQQTTVVYTQPQYQTPTYYTQPVYPQTYQQPIYYPASNVVYSSGTVPATKTQVIVRHVYSDSPNQTNTNINSTPTNQPATTVAPATNSNDDLASNAVFGSNSFLPSGLIQWIFFAIIILLIVVLARKVFGAKEEYHSTPLKHE
jgi:hypothetical protein